MGDLVCGPQYSSQEPLMSVMPPQVCEVPPPEEQVCSAEPISKDQYTAPKASPPSGSSSTELSFLDNEAKVCREPLAFKQSRTHLSAERFESTLDNSLMVADLTLKAKDINGAQNRSSGDIQGEITKGKISLNQELFAPALYALKGQTTTSDNTTTKIKDVSFNGRNQTYTLKLEVTKEALGFIPFWDNFEVQFKAKDGVLRAQIDDNWFPNSAVLNQLQGKIKDSISSKLPEQYQGVKFDVSQHDDYLELKPSVKNLTVPLAEQGDLTLESIDSDKARVSIDSKGHLHLNLNKVAFEGSTSQGGPKAVAQGPADSLNLEVKLGLRKDQGREVFAKGDLSVDLDAQETANFKVGHDTLGHYLKSGTLKNNFSLHLNQQKGQAPKVENRNFLDILNADLGQGKKVDLQTRMQLKYTPQNGFHLETQAYDYEALKLNTSPNGVELMVNGEEYFPKMKELISQATESVDLETFMFTEDEIGKEVAYLLARKAAGLTPSGPACPDDKSPDGVDVRFIFNSWKGSHADGQASADMLDNARKTVIQEIQDAPLPQAQKDKMVNQVQNKLNWTFFTEGILRSDHRKVLVVDGSQATVGGMNIGERYMSDHGYHDVMLKVAGPEVQQIHKEFIENWHEFKGQALPTEQEWSHLLKSKAELESSLASLKAQGHYAHNAQVQTLVTDDQQVDIERGLVKLIDEAQTEINIQQAFFRDETINRHLAKAMERGVKINVIVAETPLAEDVFTPANLLSVYELAKLKKAGASGDIQLYYYGANQEGKRSQIHTKAITSDGQRAIIGSANMIGRSLSSPFLQSDENGQLKQAMFNKELSLWIDNPDFVHEINQRLFEKDMTHHTRQLNVEAIEEEVKKAGGEAALRKKALAAPLT